MYCYPLSYHIVILCYPTVLLQVNMSLVYALITKVAYRGGSAILRASVSGGFYCSKLQETACMQTQ
jgi:hypothetical protein